MVSRKRRITAELEHSDSGLNYGQTTANAEMMKKMKGGGMANMMRGLGGMPGQDGPRRSFGASRWKISAILRAARGVKARLYGCFSASNTYLFGTEMQQPQISGGCLILSIATV